MSFTDKLMFWKKQDPLDIDLDKPLGGDTSASALGQPPSDFSPSQSIPSYPTGMPESQQPQPQSSFGSPDPMNTPLGNPVQSQSFDSFGSQPSHQQPSSMGMGNFGAPQSSQPTYQQEASPTSSSQRDTELILAKLESIRTSVEHLSTRVGQLERLQNEKNRW